MKKTLAISIIFLFVLGIFIPYMGSVAFAAEPAAYQPLVEIPGVTDSVTTSGSLSTFIPKLYTIVISLSIAIGVVMFTVHAFQYLSSEVSIGTKQKAKDGMRNVVIGLLLIFSAYIILQTINPALVKFDLTPPKATSTFVTSQRQLPNAPAAECGPTSPTPTEVGVYMQVRRPCTQNGQVVDELVWQLFNGPPTLETYQRCAATIGTIQGQGLNVQCKFLNPFPDPNAIPACGPNTPPDGVYIWNDRQCRNDKGVVINEKYYTPAPGFRNVEMCKARLGPGNQCVQFMSGEAIYSLGI